MLTLVSRGQRLMTPFYSLYYAFACDMPYILSGNRTLKVRPKTTSGSRHSARGPRIQIFGYVGQFNMIPSKLSHVYFFVGGGQSLRPDLLHLDPPLHCQRLRLDCQFLQSLEDPNY